MQNQSSILTLNKYGVAFGDRIVLSAIDISIPDRGTVVLLGPGGSGKSTLLRTLAGFNSANPSFRTWGTAHYVGEPLGSAGLPALVSQSARLMMSSVFENIVHSLPERETLTSLRQRNLAKRLLQFAGLDELSDDLDRKVVSLPLAVQRHLAILRQAAAGPKLLCIDEPTTGLTDEESALLLDYIRKEAERRSVVVVLHHQEQARSLEGHAALLAGGVIQEFNSTKEFFENPRSEVTREFVRNGSCCVPAPDANPEELDENVEPPVVPEEAREYVSDAFGPRGFLWLKNGVLAGTPRPGVFLDIEYDLKALQRVGVTVLVSLTQTPVDAKQLGEYGITNLWEPIEDMGAPAMEQAQSLCQKIDEYIEKGEVVAAHCRAGLGRTGTVLAAYLIWEGASALEALERVRCVEPRWVQSEEQVAFLEEFATYVANLASGTDPAVSKAVAGI